LRVRSASANVTFLALNPQRKEKCQKLVFSTLSDWYEKTFVTENPVRPLATTKGQFANKKMARVMVRPAHHTPSTLPAQTVKRLVISAKAGIQ
jgi:hypothetical protein